MESKVTIYQTMLLIRRFEERLLEEFSRGNISGTTHTCIGQEANAVGVISAIDNEDVIFSNHRCHGHYLAYGGDPYPLAAELMGKASGLVAGRGGSQHIHFRNFYTNGIQGGIVPVATGMAMAEKCKTGGNIVLVFLGDGTMGQGVLYESLNIASLWSLPILFIVENNRIAQTTPIDQAVAGSIIGRFNAFDISATEMLSNDVMEIHSNAAGIIEHVRNKLKPAALILNTHRFAAHSKGDDTRSQSELDEIRLHDPLLVHGVRLSKKEREVVERSVIERILTAFQNAESDPPASASGA